MIYGDHLRWGYRLRRFFLNLFRPRLIELDIEQRVFERVAMRMTWAIEPHMPALVDNFFAPTTLFKELQKLEGRNYYGTQSLDHNNHARPHG